MQGKVLGHVIVNALSDGLVRKRGLPTGKESVPENLIALPCGETTVVGVSPNMLGDS